MRLIDADALIEELRDKLKEALGLESQDASGLQLAIDIVEDTVDVEPVRHGRWEKRDGKKWCSLCGASNKAYEPPYCPHCGNPMDGGVSNEG